MIKQRPSRRCCAHIVLRIITSMKLVHPWLLGVPLLVGSMVLARAAFMPDGSVDPVRVTVVDATRCMEPGDLDAARAADLHAQSPGCTTRRDP